MPCAITGDLSDDNNCEKSSCAIVHSAWTVRDSCDGILTLTTGATSDPTVQPLYLVGLYTVL